MSSIVNIRGGKGNEYVHRELFLKWKELGRDGEIAKDHYDGSKWRQCWGDSGEMTSRWWVHGELVCRKCFGRAGR